ncbi:hypothetical protein RD792_002409 [Penstemon davidsonii]|uniref:Homeobox domain-containing protein n=1 Tax=Penstemon davidsonii TaxID=160366 RepID=A0ABR0DRN3_9LAMI|nr:hypothetical protein RD792_002409 [Penstemon davidsonii]
MTCTSHQQQQWHHDTNSTSFISSTAPCHRYTTPVEERTPEPKPRWNPRPEQIRILESIFNSGMINPPRDEIRKIRAQLQEYGQVGDANVFYWFQNRKSRSKHKQKQRQHLSKKPIPPNYITSSSNSSSNSDKSSPPPIQKSLSTVMDLLNSPTASVNQQPFFQAANSSDYMTEPFFFPVQHNTTSAQLGGFCFPAADASDQNVGGPSFLFSELLLMSKKPEDDDDKIMKLQEQLSYGVTAAPNTTNSTYNNNIHLPPSPSLPFPSPTANHVFQGEPGPTKSTVFINDVCIEVGFGPFNVREAFGDDSVLVQSTGQPVLTNEWGLTLQPLQHGAFYYLVRAFAPSPVDRTIDLI